MYLRIPCIGYYDDLCIAVPKAPAVRPTRAYAKFDDRLFLVPGENKSGAESVQEFSVVSISFLYECEEVVASLSLSKERVDEPAICARDLRNWPGITSPIAEIGREITFRSYCGHGEVCGGSSQTYT